MLAVWNKPIMDRLLKMVGESRDSLVVFVTTRSNDLKVN